MKNFLFLLLLISSNIFSQDLSKFYNNGDTSMSKKWVTSSWESGTIVLLDGSEISCSPTDNRYFDCIKLTRFFTSPR